jgi:hypothetical protein
MDAKKAQDIAFKWANLNSLNITLAEIKTALVVLANFYEDNKCPRKGVKRHKIQPKECKKGL